MMEVIDGELHMFDQDGNVAHVYERGGDSRAAYMHMVSWIQKNFETKNSFQKNWQEAEEAWDALGPELQAHLMLMSDQEEQCARDIRLGLLATLAEYRGFSFVKKLFEEAIKGVRV